jgi:partner of Y14 and mago protein
MATQYVRGDGDNGGETFIAASQRPDGSWRKQRRVKQGFVPQEEVPLYESKGKKLAKGRDGALPPGLSPQLWEEMKQKQKQVQLASEAGVEPVKGGVKSAIPLATGLTVEDTNSWTTVNKSKKGKKKKGKGGAVEEVVVAAEEVDKISNRVQGLDMNNEGGQDKRVTNEQGQPLATDPVKRLRNLRKKLKDIEALKLKDPNSLEKEQLEKIERYPEVVCQIQELEDMIG